MDELRDTQYNLPIGTDCISRRKLLDKFEPWLEVHDYNDGERNVIKAVLYEIKCMPPATDTNAGTKLGTNLAEVGTDLAEVGTRAVRGYPIDADALMAKVAEEYGERARDTLYRIIKYMPPAQPKTATVTIGRTKGGVTMWYECDACGEPIDQNDCYCRKCGRKLKHE